MADGPVMTEAAKAAIRVWIDQQHAQLDRVSYFQLLGVERDADEAAVRTAYYHLVARFHPDLYGDNLDEVTRGKLVRLYSRLVEAYQTLSDAQRRTGYLHSLGEGKLRVSPGVRTRKETLSSFVANPSARRFLKLGQSALAAGDAKTAAMNFKLALSVEPKSELIKTELAKAEAILKGTQP
jgi:hypothetical protein